VDSSQSKMALDHLKQSRQIVSDLLKPKAYWYWTDYLLSATVAYSCSFMFVQGNWSSPISWCFFAVAVTFLYRISMFVHESVHLHQGQVPGFKNFWNLTAGVVLLMPTFAYESHLAHHNTKEYGTEHDGEYLPLASSGWKGLVFFFSQVFIQPVLVFLRFLIGTPISFLHPSLRQWMHIHASSLVINFRYEKHPRLVRLTAGQTLLELACFLRAACIPAVVLLGFDSPDRVLKLYLMAVAALSMNHFRTLAAHRYESDGNTMSHVDQFLDSTNVTGNWLTEILCPVGLRYHALHHLFPKMPYHNLGIAHRRAA